MENKHENGTMKLLTLLCLVEVSGVMKNCCKSTSSCDDCILFQKVNGMASCGMTIIENILKDNGFGD